MVDNKEIKEAVDRETERCRAIAQAEYARWHEGGDELGGSSIAMGGMAAAGNIILRIACLTTDR